MESLFQDGESCLLLHPESARPFWCFREKAHCNTLTPFAHLLAVPRATHRAHLRVFLSVHCRGRGRPKRILPTPATDYNRPRNWRDELIPDSDRCGAVRCALRAMLWRCFECANFLKDKRLTMAQLCADCARWPHGKQRTPWAGTHVSARFCGRLFLVDWKGS